MFLIPKRDMFLDGWSYGDWTQFIAMLPGDQCQCCRRALSPTVVSMIGAVLLVIVGAVFVMKGGPLDTIDRVMALAGGALQAPVMVELATGSVWVVPLGPVINRDANGNFWRIFPCEVDE